MINIPWLPTPNLQAVIRETTAPIINSSFFLAKKRIDDVRTAGEEKYSKSHIEWALLALKAKIPSSRNRRFSIIVVFSPTNEGNSFARWTNNNEMFFCIDRPQIQLKLKTRRFFFLYSETVEKRTMVQLIEQDLLFAWLVNNSFRLFFAIFLILGFEEILMRKYWNEEDLKKGLFWSELMKKNLDKVNFIFWEK